MMKTLKMVSKIMMMGVLVFGLAYTVLAFSQPVFADCGGVQTSIINGTQYINFRGWNCGDGWFYFLWIPVYDFEK